MNTIPLELDVQMFLRLLIAVVFGARVGKPAGVRTHGMVSLGAALFAVVSIHGFGGTGDPARVAAQIVTGIGFLGAGAILHQRSNVHGLAVGVGMVLMSLATAVLVFLLLRFGPRPRRQDRNHDAE